jgi:bifunctional non-homologous end joining protein LigD
VYPDTGTTKAENINYYMTVAPAILTLMDGRPVTRKRWPSGVEEKPFFEKNLPASTPDWVARVTLRHSGERSGRGARDLDYPLVNDVATLVWLAQGGALELHAPQGRMDATTGLPAAPDRLVIDLDPGPPAGLDECNAARSPCSRGRCSTLTGWTCAPSPVARREFSCTRRFPPRRRGGVRCTRRRAHPQSSRAP